MKTTKKETLKINSQSRFLIYAIYFYRFLGISFGGISIDKNGNIIKSSLWYHFGWLGFVIYSILIIFYIIYASTDTLYQPIGLTIYLITNIIWYTTDAIIICSTLVIYHKYGFKIIKMFLKHSLTKYSNLKLIKIIWIAHLLVLLLTFIIQSSLFPYKISILYAICQSLLLMP